MWASGHNGDIKRATHGYEPTREAAMASLRAGGATNAEAHQEDGTGRQPGTLPTDPSFSCPDKRGSSQPRQGALEALGGVSNSE